MSGFTRPLPSHIRNGSLSQSGQSTALQARVNEKRAELASLRELQALSAAVADQMQMLEDKLSNLADGTEG
jgi:DASH complex subunit DAD2